MKRFHRDGISSEVETRTGPFSSPSQLTPPSSKKRKLQFGQSSNLEGEQNTRLLENFRRLDPSNPAEAKRINTRKKQVQKGKNTVGYDLYIKKISKESRKKIPEHPSTPDYRADIPNRRWLGQLKAWRISLHQYDPSDLKSDITHESKEQNLRKNELLNKSQDSQTQTSTKAQSVKQKEIEDASKSGLDVDFDFQSSENHDVAGAHNNANGIEVNEKDKESNFVSINTDIDQELDKWESNRVSGTNDDELLDYDDSDDDIL